MICPVAYIPYSDFSAVPDPSIDRIDWGNFGSVVSNGVAWFLNWIKYLLDLLFSVPVNSEGASFMGFVIYISLIFVIVRFFMVGFNAGVPNKVTGGGADYK